MDYLFLDQYLTLDNLDFLLKNLYKAKEQQFVSLKLQKHLSRFSRDT